MQTMLPCALLLTIVLGAAAQSPSDMDGQLFDFPKQSITDYVMVIPELTGPLASFTICLRASTELPRQQSLFSGSSSKFDNEVLLYFYRNLMANPYYVYVGNDTRAFNAPENIKEQNHFCAVWASSTGVVQLWINGKPSTKKLLKQGYSIPKDLQIILGQEQDSFGGSFDATQCFVGKMGDVHMWDYALSTEDIQQVMCNNKQQNGNIISWRALRYEKYGGVLVEPVQQRACESQA